MHKHTMDFNVSGILDNPEYQWKEIKRNAMGKSRVAFRKLDVDWKKYNTNDYLFTHDTACCSVETEENGYWIKSPCWELVNANGNAWTTPVLLASFKTFIGGDNFLEHCFVKGTQILMADGQHKNIEDIKEGDEVVNAKNEKDTVSFIHVNTTEKLVKIIDGDKTTICTPEHPFLTVEGYVKACELNGKGILDECNAIHEHYILHQFDKTETVYNLSVENDESYIANGYKVHNCQIPALSKGKILDAIARPVVHHSEKYGDANIYIIDCLVATSRKHESLIDRIESGKLNTLSMGTLASYTQCSICGKIIGDNDKNCEHIDRHLGQMCTCQDGKERICAELCGACDENGNYIEGSNEFIELSWVEHPAFKGAVVNEFVETSEIRASRETDRDELSKLFEGNLFERLKVADKNSKIALKITKEIGKIDRISGSIMDKIEGN